MPFYPAAVASPCFQPIILEEETQQIAPNQHFRDSQKMTQNLDLDRFQQYRTPLQVSEIGKQVYRNAFR